MTKPIVNVAASVRQRLLNLARERKEDFGLVLTRYGLERVLYRIAQSKHRDVLVLKGALLFELWTEQRYRPTRDADFLARGENSRSGSWQSSKGPPVVQNDGCVPADIRFPETGSLLRSCRSLSCAVSCCGSVAGRDRRVGCPSKRSKVGHLTTMAGKFRQARTKAGLPKSLVLYCGRHDFGTRVLKKTGNLKLVMQTMGRIDVKTAMKYQHPELRHCALGFERHAARRAAVGRVV